MTIELAKAQATAAYYQERAANAEYLLGVWKKRAIANTDLKNCEMMSQWFADEMRAWRAIAEKLDYDEAWRLYEERKKRQLDE